MPRPGGSVLVLPPGAGRHLTGPVTEEVLLLRDEMANLAWAVERYTRDPAGLPVDRASRYQRLRPEAAAPTISGAGRYRRGSTVPDYWYPLQGGRDENQRPVLLLACLPGEATEVPDTGVRGSILDHGLGAWVLDEEVPGEGALVTRRWHRAR